MNIYEVIETCHLEIDHLNDHVYNELMRTYTDDQWINAGKFLLNGLDRNHRISGKPIKQFVGIVNDYKEFRSITREQKWLLIHLVIENWDQLSCEAKSALML